MTDSEREPDAPEVEDATGGLDEQEQEALEDLESDPARNPDDPDLERIKGG